MQSPVVPGWQVRADPARWTGSSRFEKLWLILLFVCMVHRVQAVGGLSCRAPWCSLVRGVATPPLWCHLYQRTRWSVPRRLAVPREGAAPPHPGAGIAMGDVPSADLDLVGGIPGSALGSHQQERLSPPQGGPLSHPGACWGRSLPPSADGFPGLCLSPADCEPVRRGANRFSGPWALPLTVDLGEGGPLCPEHTASTAAAQSVRDAETGAAASLQL